MLVEQAIFTSVRSRKSQGYHLVAASSGLDESLVRALAKWGPSHASLLSDRADAESWNYHPVAGPWWAVSRTTHGGPEYSGRGGLQVFTHYVIVQHEHLAGYDQNPLRLARTARTMGYLRLHLPKNDVLPVIDLPDRSLAPLAPGANTAAIPLHDILRILRLQGRIAILGLDDPLPTLTLILQETPAAERPLVSFATGLRISVDREFRVHFSRSADTTLNAQLRHQGIDSVMVA